MQNDWDSLFFSYRPHTDQQPHEAHLLADVGLVRTVDGGLALAEDPTYRVDLAPPSLWQRIGAALRPAGVTPKPVALRACEAGHRQ